MNDRANGSSVVLLGATGAVGGAVLDALLASPVFTKITTLGRRPVSASGPDVAQKLDQHVVDVFDPATYKSYLSGHDVAICTFGVGQPSKMSKDEFVRIDADVPRAFAAACKAAGVRHFSLLSSVDADEASRIFYLRTKGQLEASITAIAFSRTTFVHPSMILTEKNRYGVTQGVTLWLFPKIEGLLAGRLRKYRGIAVSTLGTAIVRSAEASGQGVETLEWDDFMRLTAEQGAVPSARSGALRAAP